MKTQAFIEEVRDANEALRGNAIGGYVYFLEYLNYDNTAALVYLDGEFDLEDLKKIVEYLTNIQEVLSK